MSRRSRQVAYVHVRGFACFAMSGLRFTCYRLDYVTWWGSRKTYWGSTQLRGSQDQQRAANVRLRGHLERPLECMSTGVRDTFTIAPQGPVLCERNCLAQEAIYVALALEQDSSARGALFSCVKVGRALQNTAANIRKCIAGLGPQAAREAVIRYASNLNKGHPLCRHLAGEPFTAPQLTNADLPVQIRSGRFGVQGNITRQRQLDRAEYKYGSPTHIRLKRGLDPEGRVAAGEARRKEKRRTMKRPAARPQ